MKRRTTARKVAQLAIPTILLASIFSLVGLGAQTAAPPAKPVAKPTVKPTVTVAPGPKPQLLGKRMKFQDFVKDQHRLDSLIKAVGVMKTNSTRPPGDFLYRISWEYWGAMHGFFGKGAKAGMLQDAINRAPANKKQFFEGLHDLTYPPTPPGLAQQVWDKCTHSGAQVNLQFLTWHRIYLFYFEKVLQASANDTTLHLPYWDYTDPAQVQLPAAFAKEKLSNGQPNPLYDKRRRSQTVKLDPAITNIDTLLTESDFEDFSPDLEQQPHGTTHCAVGPDCPYPLMGKVAVAGNDPIFWLHHANIDRIFECWLKLGGDVPADLLDKEYPFIDANGNLVKMTLRKLPIDYTYDHVTSCGRKATPKFGPRTEGLEAVQPVVKVENFAINKAKESVKLAVPKTGAATEHLNRALATAESVSAPRLTRTELALGDITIPGDDPGVLYNVFLTTTGANPRRQYVGTLSFFGLDHHEGASKTLNRKIDVTAALKALKGKLKDLPEIQVVFEATDGTPGVKPESLTPQGGLRVGSIQLQVKGK
ncbi:MAG TPA: tyrosinase family protein [Thermoanaerobaculia bacterium]|nr:tyrosinase family protein [Thermoanaerobaculia bacterium]